MARVLQMSDISKEEDMESESAEADVISMSKMQDEMVILEREVVILRLQKKKKDLLEEKAGLELDLRQVICI